MSVVEGLLSLRWRILSMRNPYQTTRIRRALFLAVLFAAIPLVYYFGIISTVMTFCCVFAVCYAAVGMAEFLS